jgi:hypothetical protein
VGPGLTKLHKAQGATFKNGATNIAAGEEGSVDVPINEATYAFQFYNKRLVGVFARFNADVMPFEKLLTQATTKYGAKSPRIERTALRNGFGATWVVRNTAWTNPDNCVVKVEEGIKDGTRFTYEFVHTAAELKRHQSPNKPAL